MLTPRSPSSRAAYRRTLAQIKLPTRACTERSYLFDFGSSDRALAVGDRECSLLNVTGLARLLARRRVAFRALATALAVLLLGGQALSLLHEIIVPHEVCAEHGELVHSSSHALAGVSRHAQPVNSISASNAPQAHEHDHCTVATRRVEQLAAPLEQSTYHIAIDSITAGIGEAETASAVGPPLLQLAPKQSPPA